MNRRHFYLVLKFTSIYLLFILTSCYTIVKTENESKKIGINKVPVLNKLKKNTVNRKIKYAPNANSNIQIQYYFSSNGTSHIITQIDNSGYIKRYSLEKEFLILNEEFQIDSTLYNELIYLFNQCRFIHRNQYPPRSEHFLFTLHSIVISYHQSKNDRFKHLVLYLPIDKRYSSRGFKTLFNKLMKTTKEFTYANR